MSLDRQILHLYTGRRNLSRLFDYLMGMKQKSAFKPIIDIIKRHKVIKKK